MRRPDISTAVQSQAVGMILICFDGSADARAAIQRAGELFNGETATVLTIWQPFIQVMARTSVGFGLVPPIPDIDRVDAGNKKRAEEVVQQGVELARAAGLDAKPRVSSQLTTTGRAILAEADAVGADAIVMGSRGLTGVKSLLLGSVSHEVIQHADRTVVVVPSPEVAGTRAQETRKTAEG